MIGKAGTNVRTFASQRTGNNGHNNFLYSSGFVWGQTVNSLHSDFHASVACIFKGDGLIGHCVLCTVVPNLNHVLAGRAQFLPVE